MVFLADVFVPCDVCGGSRFKRELLDVRIQGASIHDVLQWTVEEAITRFRHQPKLGAALWHLHQVGLGYLRLGQPATTLSGGEAQRLKIARELAGAKKKGARKLYILDEPTTGLHLDDVRVLLQVLDRLVDAGNTVLVIEHHLDVIKRADWVIDLGPEAGDDGGRLVVEGTPETVAARAESLTGRYLQPYLERALSGAFRRDRAVRRAPPPSGTCGRPTRPSAAVIRRAGPCELEPRLRHSPFEELLESIVYQQLSGKAAATIYGRVRALFPARRALAPQALLDAPEEALRGAGLSRAKLAAARDLAAKTLEGVVPTAAALRRMPDEEIIERLTAVRGVGTWTVQMLLIFRLGRPDVLPIHDLGIQKGFQRTYETRQWPKPARIERHGERWRPVPLGRVVVPLAGDRSGALNHGGRGVDRLLGAGERQHVPRPQLLVSRRQHLPFLPSTERHHRRPGQSPQVEFHEGASGRRVAGAHDHLGQLADPGQHLPRLLEDAAGGGRVLHGHGERLDDHVGAGLHVPLQVAGGAPEGDAQQDQQHRDEERATVAGEERQRHGHRRHADDQHDADLDGEPERTARRGAEIGTSGARGGHGLERDGLAQRAGGAHDGVEQRKERGEGQEQRPALHRRRRQAQPGGQRRRCRSGGPATRRSGWWRAGSCRTR